MLRTENGSIRQLESKDLAEALKLSIGAGWNQTLADWQTLLNVEPAGCFALDGNDGLAATATLVSYGRELGWLGMVLTRHDHRRRGFARRLVTAALEYASKRGVQTVKLDATQQGQGLYESLGFVAEAEVERWSRVCTSENSILPALEYDWEAVQRLDREAFGVARTRILASFRDRGQTFTGDDGFAMTRAGGRATYLGPVVCHSEPIGRVLIERCLAELAGSCFWDILPGNESAAALAKGFGFCRERSLLRMSRGRPFAQRADLIYGIAGFEFG